MPRTCCSSSSSEDESVSCHSSCVVGSWEWWFGCRISWRQQDLFIFKWCWWCPMIFCNSWRLGRTETRSVVSHGYVWLLSNSSNCNIYLTWLKRSIAVYQDTIKSHTLTFMYCEAKAQGNRELSTYEYWWWRTMFIDEELVTRYFIVRLEERDVNDHRIAL